MSSQQPPKSPATGYNSSSPSIKRILSELKELQREPNSELTAQPLEDNLFEWHFTIRGPSDTEFAGGRYHGRIILPTEYPFKPPSIVLLTPSGRFETGKKICLSITGYHPEFWQPAWGIRTALMALISFFPTKAEGAIAGLDWSKEERIKLARESEDWVCPVCGVAMRDCLNGQGNDGDAQSSSSTPSSPTRSGVSATVDLSMFQLSYEDSRKNSSATVTESGPSNAVTAAETSLPAVKEETDTDGELRQRTNRAQSSSSSSSTLVTGQTRPSITQTTAPANVGPNRNARLFDALLIIVILYLLIIIMRRLLIWFDNFNR